MHFHRKSLLSFAYLEYKREEVFLITLFFDFCGQRVAFGAKSRKRTAALQGLHDKPGTQRVDGRAARESQHDDQQRVRRRAVVRLGAEDAVPQKVPQHGDLVQDVNAQRRARQPVDEPVAAEVQIFEEVEQCQRRQQAGQCAQRRAVVGNVLERLAVGRAPVFQHRTDGGVGQRQAQAEDKRRGGAVQQAGQAVIRPAAQVGSQQVIVEEHPRRIAQIPSWPNTVG